MTQADELKSCLHCKGVAESMCFVIEGMVRCKDCGSCIVKRHSGPQVDDGEDRAIAAWNTRPQPDPAAANTTKDNFDQASYDLGFAEAKRDTDFWNSDAGKDQAGCGDTAAVKAAVEALRELVEIDDYERSKNIHRYEGGSPNGKSWDRARKALRAIANHGDGG